MQAGYSILYIDEAPLSRVLEEVRPILQYEEKIDMAHFRQEGGL